MTATAQFPSDVSQIFDNAVGAFGDTLKASVKAQEEMLKIWSGTLNAGGPVGDWQKQSQAFFDRTAPAVQKSAEEWLKLVEQNYKRSVELLKKAVDGESAESAASVQERTQKLWQSLLELVRENTQATAQTNVRLVEMWAEILRKNVEQFETAAAEGVAAASKAVGAKAR